ncbi:MAG: polysaccharide deacetylase family protein, partial [Nitrospirae bacterium]|nr:polysaccharide deacetylase family protein [Nitrospirota bacterium]
DPAAQGSFFATDGCSGRLRTVRTLVLLLHKGRIDVLHSHGMATYFYAVLAALAAHTRVVIHSVHEPEARAIPVWKTALARALARRVDHFVADTQAHCDELLRRWHVKPEQILYLRESTGLSAVNGDVARRTNDRGIKGGATESLYQEHYWRARLSTTVSLHDRAKTLLGKGLAWSGATAVAIRRQGDTLKILTYHRVLPLHEAMHSPFQAMVMPRDHFEAQMAHLARRYRVLAFGDAMKLLQAGELPPRAVTVTFDDGYVDNYEHAWPVLKKYEIPATLFVVTGVLDRSAFLWWDAIGRAVPDLLHRWRLGWGRQAGLPQGVQDILSQTAESGDVRSAGQRLGNVLNALPREPRQQLIATLLPTTSTTTMNDELMLTWEQVRAMHREGWEIGAHTVTHAFVDELDESSVRREIQMSIHRVEQELNGPVRVFSYPRGRVADHVKTVLRDLGVEAAVSTEPGQNRRGVDMYHLKRFDMGICRSPGRFSAAVCDAEISGLFQFLRRS